MRLIKSNGKAKFVFTVSKKLLKQFVILTDVKIVDSDVAGYNDKIWPFYVVLPTCAEIALPQARPVGETASKLLPWITGLARNLATCKWFIGDRCSPNEYISYNEPIS